MITSGIGQKSTRKRSSFQNLEDQIKNLKNKNTQGLSRAAQNIQIETAKKKAETAKNVQGEAGKIQYEKPLLETQKPPEQTQVNPKEEDYQKIADKLKPNLKPEKQPNQWNPDFNEYFNRFADEYENLQNQLGNSVDVGSENYLNELRQQAALNYQKYLDDLESQRGEQFKSLQEKNKTASDKLKKFQEQGEYIGNIGKEGGLETSAQEINKILEGGSNLDAIAALRGRFADPRFGAIDQQLMSQDIAEARGQAALANRMLESAKGAQEESSNQYGSNIEKYGKEQQEGIQKVEGELNKTYDDLRKNSKIQDLESMKDQVSGKTRNILEKMIENDTVQSMQKTISGPLQEMETDVYGMIDRMGGMDYKDQKWHEGRIKERLASTQKMLMDLQNSSLPDYVKSSLSSTIQTALNNMKREVDARMPHPSRHTPTGEDWLPF